MEKLFYSISEVAELLGESTTLVRFWANSFPKHIKPQRNAKGNRQFKAEDLETFRQIHFLVKESGFTLDGAAKQLDRDRYELKRRMRVLESLKSMRGQLLEISKTL